MEEFELMAQAFREFEKKATKKWDCSCLVHYPNENYKFKNGKWKCVDKYECIRDKVDGRCYDCKTHCKRKAF